MDRFHQITIDLTKPTRGQEIISTMKFVGLRTLEDYAPDASQRTIDGVAAVLEKRLSGGLRSLLPRF